MLRGCTAMLGRILGRMLEGCTIKIELRQRNRGTVATGVGCDGERSTPGPPGPAATESERAYGHNQKVRGPGVDPIRARQCCKVNDTIALTMTPSANCNAHGIDGSGRRGAGEGMLLGVSGERTCVRPTLAVGPVQRTGFREMKTRLSEQGQFPPSSPILRKFSASPGGLWTN